MKPLISCIMPTSGKRKDFVQQAIKYFNKQDYPNKELVLIDENDTHDSCASVIYLFPEFELRYFVISVTRENRLTIGMKRNLACSLARGKIICHWDDDDYYGPQRLSKQVEPLLQGNAEISAMRMSLLLHAREGTLWTCDDCTHNKLFKQDIRCGTLMYWAFYWHQGVYFASVNAGEDVRFLYSLLARNARLERIVDPASYICVRHGDNVSADIVGMDLPGWQQVPIDQYILEEDRVFYAGLQEKVKI